MNLNLNNIRSIIALLVVGTYMLSLIVAIIFPFLRLNANLLDSFATYFSKTSGAYTGIVGVIVGYYFARNTNNNSNGDYPSGSSENPTGPEPLAPKNPTTPSGPNPTPTSESTDSLSSVAVPVQSSKSTRKDEHSTDATIYQKIEEWKREHTPNGFLGI